MKLKPVAGHGKSKVTNGETLFIDGVDGRSMVARRFRDLYNQFIIDIERSAPADEAQRQLARRAAALCVEAELIEVDLVGRREIDVERYCRISNTMLRVFRTLGIEAPPDQKAAGTATSLEEYTAQARQRP